MTIPKLIVFSDLDGTLLDHHSYDFSAALPTLALLQQHHIPLILNSSKTSAEIAALRTELNNTHPYIVENGAAVIIPRHYFANDEEQQVLFTQPLAQVRSWLREIRAQENFRFSGFQDMSVDDVVACTGLSQTQAQLAMQRMGTEPLLWQDSEDALTRLQPLLSQAGLQMVRGGRFIHVMGQFDKAEAMLYLLQRYQQQWPDTPLISIALGDSPNDTNMLQAADYAVVIKGVRSDAVNLNKKPGRELRSREPGPTGWNQCLSTLVAALLGPSPNNS